MDILKNKIVYFDGGMGTMLQSSGLKAWELPETLNISSPELIIDIHKQYINAGCDIIKSNTFGANRLKLKNTEFSAEQIISAGVKNARVAAGDKLVAMDIGPTGQLLQPLGTLSFEEAYEIFSEMAIAGEKSGADLVLIETMSDTYEAKAAVLAVKENTKLPVFVTMTFDEKGKLLTGGDIQTVVAILEGLGVDALGMNCGLGPRQIRELFLTLRDCTSIPIILNPNAGLPVTENGVTHYNISADEFADEMKSFAELGATIIGGCCGTTPKHIAKMIEKTKNTIPQPIIEKEITVVSSYGSSVIIGKTPVIIGERINPTGKKRFKEALREADIDYILDEGFTQVDSGAHILDVNVGLPEIDEVQMMVDAVTQLQAVIKLPLQIDSTDKNVIEKALRIYNGKALVNSVNGKKEIMDEIFPIVKKYGGVVVGLTLDENGIPDTAEGRYEIAKKIIETAEGYGIHRKNIIIDTLTLTISSDQAQSLVTLDALKLVKQRLGVATVLGVSNVSFGLPQREIINSTFYALALQSGLDAAIINPSSEPMMKTYYSFNALFNYDKQCDKYISKYSNVTPQKAIDMDNLSIEDIIVRGMKEKSYSAAQKHLETEAPMDVINKYLIPALDIVGKGFEKGTIFLPQLLLSAETASNAFDAVKDYMLKSGIKQENKGKIVLATVKGDIHDIGKNIVKVLLQNYGYDVIDLGKDVPIEAVVEAVKANNVKLVGLSALMTTTVPSMEATIKALRKENLACSVFVGGAVLTQEYSDMIGADFYAKDAMASVYYAQEKI